MSWSILLRLAVLVSGKAWAAEALSEFQAALQEPYKGHCAEPPQAQLASVAEPPSRAVLEAANLELMGVQIAFRHGARDLSSDTLCFSPMVNDQKKCNVKPLLTFSGNDAMSGAAQPLIKEVLDAYPLTEGNETRVAGCGKGVLLNQAIPQTKALAEAIRQRFFHRLASIPSLETTRLYSTGKERTTATLFLLQQSLFEGQAAMAPAKLYSRPVSSDPWDLNQHCPRAGHARHARHYETTPEFVKERFPSFPARWRQAAGTDFQPNYNGCLLVAMCSGQEALKLPAGLQPNSSLFQETLRNSLSLYQERYSKDKQAIRLLAAPVLAELEHFMLQQVTGSGPLMALWATHDSTIIIILSALGAWNGQWPPYTDTIVLEVYRESGVGKERRGFFRFLHHGTPITFPWCKSAEKQVDGLCDVHQFLPAALARLRDPELLRSECAKGEEATEAIVAVQATAFGWLGNSIVISVCCLASCVLGMFLQALRHAAHMQHGDYLLL
eukprot:CAMPEP_0197643758 /NCGR_PEP_ID=MMETSP1338-20131121/16964_1 /TAXON_ID=43686 ORGANISM="Pelagodinium beii, Strain RCC1491" /NCGR_SAMPLE_ID=MMETSP1338 /ASSEMBLY_ACC=CAM_ASM_000754 /LENGTH=497 /DNA_ID=CAMNT_0043217045 /DNA_START=35 /DNA_END=1528 /DNA_ORIENTATION=-